ncbi:MAG: chorismate-binding protein [Ignavibacteriales bacterium]|nr:chorismate-binding protein [Ignavibacteriales bacterium]
MRKEGKQSFLLETVEGKESLGRYSFIGIDPIKIISNRGLSLKISDSDGEEKREQNIFDYLKEELHTRNHLTLEELPSFTGGTVGYLAYENISLIEKKLKLDSSVDDQYDSILGVYDTVLAFDHYKHQVIIITNVAVTEGVDLEDLYRGAKQKIKELRAKLSAPLHFESDFKFDRDVSENISDEVFCELVELSKKNIVDGDVFQIVLSKRFTTKYEGDLFNVYRALRIINPSPYMYFLEFETGLTIIGTSPENLVKVQDGIVEVMPIAGTRRRGSTPEEDQKLEMDLVNDPKEIAEHVMLVDLGRNDVGRVSEFGTVKLKEKDEDSPFFPCNAYSFQS